jgi:predicted exporter
LIPVVGALASAIAWTAVLMMVFEEVDGIGRLEAFLISAGINAIFLALLFLLPH